MGTDKALLPIRGRPLGLAAAETLAAFCAPVSLVGDPARYKHLGLPVIPDEFNGLGPLAGIEAALRNTAAELNLIVACDMPSLDPGVLGRLLLAAADLAEDDRNAIFPQYGDGSVEPLCALYHRRARSAVREALESGVRRVTDAFLPHKLRYLPIERSPCFANLNTPEDLQKFQNG